jgi:hypothetical protein
MVLQVGLGGATGLGLGVGNLAGSGLSGRGGLEGLSLGSLIGGQGLPSGNRDRMGELCDGGLRPISNCCILSVHNAQFAGLTQGPGHLGR